MVDISWIDRIDSGAQASRAEKCANFILEPFRALLNGHIVTPAQKLAPSDPSFEIKERRTEDSHRSKKYWAGMAVLVTISVLPALVGLAALKISRAGLPRDKKISAETPKTTLSNRITNAIRAIKSVLGQTQDNYGEEEQVEEEDESAPKLPEPSPQTEPKRPDSPEKAEAPTAAKPVEKATKDSKVNHVAQQNPEKKKATQHALHQEFERLLNSTSTVETLSLKGLKERRLQKICDFIQAHKDELDVKDENEKTFLDKAIAEKDSAIILALITAGAKIDLNKPITIGGISYPSPLAYAIKKKNLKAVIKLVSDIVNKINKEHGADAVIGLVKKPTFYGPKDDESNTPLHYAVETIAETDKLDPVTQEILQELCKIPDIVNAKNSDGKTAFYLAVEGEKVAVAQLLLAQDPTTRLVSDNDGKLPMSLSTVLYNPKLLALFTHNNI